MATTYSLMQILPGEIRELDGPSSPSSLWYLDGGNLHTTTPYLLTKSGPFPFSNYTPSPNFVVENDGFGMVDLTPYVSAGDVLKIYAVGRMTANDIITGIIAADTYPTLEDGGDGWVYFSSDPEESNSIEVDDPQYVPLSGLVLQLQSYTNTPIGDFEIEVEYFMVVEEAPPPPPVNIGAEWYSRVFESDSSCNYDVGDVENLVVLSSTLYIYEDQDYLHTYGECLESEVEAEGQPLTTVDVLDIVQPALSITDDSSFYLSPVFIEGLTRDTVFVLDIQVQVTINGMVYGTALKAVSGSQG